MFLSLFATIQQYFASRNMQMEAFRAARTGAADDLRALLEKGYDPNMRNGEGVTAMMLAAGRGHLECVQVLVERGGDIHYKEQRKGLSALKFAVGEGRVAVAEYLLDQGADVNEIDNYGRTGLMFAAGQGSLPMVELFLSRGADANLQDVYRNTALTNAEDMQHKDIRQRLIEAGAKEVERFYLGDDDQSQS